ncbi:hypothetical protein TAL182_CH00207 [Rhizobium sp. TAL182]|nr:hypothetical protein TAL182_CH00207 [Rhizobium sp. TAL182]
MVGSTIRKIQAKNRREFGFCRAREILTLLCRAKVEDLIGIAGGRNAAAIRHRRRLSPLAKTSIHQNRFSR